eukprot:5770698-Amphidinium_carterae.1
MSEMSTGEHERNNRPVRITPSALCASQPSFELSLLPPVLWRHEIEYARHGYCALNSKQRRNNVRKAWMEVHPRELECPNQLKVWR